MEFRRACEFKCGLAQISGASGAEKSPLEWPDSQLKHGWLTIPDLSIAFETAAGNKAVFILPQLNTKPAHEHLLPTLLKGSHDWVSSS